MYTQFIVVIDTLSVQSITTILSQIKEQKQKNIPTETFAGLKYPPTKTRLWAGSDRTPLRSSQRSPDPLAGLGEGVEEKGERRMWGKWEEGGTGTTWKNRQTKCLVYGLVRCSQYVKVHQTKIEDCHGSQKQERDD